MLLLLKHEDDGFSRWDATQQLATKLLLPAMQEGESIDEERYQKLLSGMRRHLLDGLLADADVALLAEMLTLPTVQQFMEIVSVVKSTFYFPDT